MEILINSLELSKFLEEIDLSNFLCVVHSSGCCAVLYGAEYVPREIRLEPLLTSGCYVQSGFGEVINFSQHS